jgi:UDP-galactopyranose mutase
LIALRPDFLIVGTGLTGATIAHVLSCAGYSVLAVDRRSHPGGNVYDYVHPSGILVQKYGPHYFRTSSQRVWNFVQQFGSFYRYEAKVLSRVDERHENWPVTLSYIRRLIGYIPAHERTADAPNFEAAVLSIMPMEVYDRFVREYTEKQWGIPAHRLDPDLARRVQIRWDDDPRLTPRARYQGLPKAGYTELIQSMLKSIPVVLDFDYLQDRKLFRPRKMTVFTGAIDEYFDFSLGRLKYRGQRRDTTYHPGICRLQPAAQVNEPQHAGGAHIRTLEWKQLMPPKRVRRIKGTVVTKETPFSPEDSDQYEYPFPDEENRSLYSRYRALAAEEKNTLICGRLGEYRYYDMDQAIARALMLAKRLCQ